MRRISFREHSILFIRRMWVDQPGVGLPIFPNPCFGPNEPGLCLGCYGRTRAGHGAHCAFWAGEWDTWLISLSLSIYIYIYSYFLNLIFFIFFMFFLNKKIVFKICKRLIYVHHVCLTHMMCDNVTFI